MRIPKDIFFPLNTSKTKRGLGSSIPSPSFSLQDWLKDNKIKGQEFYIEDEISAPLFLPEDPLTTDPNVDYTKPLIGDSFEAFGIKFPVKGNYNKIEELISSSVFGNPTPAPNDVILRAIVFDGMADTAVIQGLGEGLELWGPVSMYHFEAYFITFGIVIRSEWVIQLGSNQIDSYVFDGFANPSERHYYAEGSLLRPDGGSNEYYVIDEAGNGTQLPPPGGGSSQITHLLAGQYSSIELSGGIYISGSEVRIDISCWQNQFQSGDISVEVFPQSGLSFPGTHNLDPANGTNSGLATIPFTSLVADTWYMVEIKLSNLAARNNVNSSDLNTDFIVTKVAFKTNSTNDGLAVTFTATSQFPYGSHMGINTYVPKFGTLTSSGTGIDMSAFNNNMGVEIYAMNSYLNAGGTGTDIFMYSVSTDSSGTDRSYFGNQLIINPVNDGGSVSLQRIIQIRLSSGYGLTNISGFEGCPYQNSDIYSEVYFHFTPSQLTQPIYL